MSHKKLFETFGNQFKSFGKELGFIEWFDNIQDYDAAIYLLREQAMVLNVEYPDSTISVQIIRLEEGKIPTNGYSVGSDGRRIRIGIDEIYDIDVPIYPGDPDTIEALQDTLNRYIEVVQNNPGVLYDFLAHIEENTTVQKTKEQMRKLIAKSLSITERDYQAGRIGCDHYERICASLRADLEKWK